jgi:hypothetical protein
MSRHNERVRARLSRPAPTLVALTAATALVLGGCSADSGSGSAEGSASSGSSGSSGSSASTSSAAPSASSTVQVPTAVELTDQGSELSFTEPARVIFESTQNKGTVLQLTVRRVRKGRLADFKNFIFDDPYKQRASYYYATVQVRNVGEGDVGGVAVPLWGVNAKNTLLPAVRFTTPFKPCPSRPLPARFPAGATLNTCLVYLSPDKGTLEAVSYRPSQQFNPITWTGAVAPPAAPATAKAKAKTKAKTKAKAKAKVKAKAKPDEKS